MTCAMLLGKWQRHEVELSYAVCIETFCLQGAYFADKFILQLLYLIETDYLSSRSQVL